MPQLPAMFGGNGMHTFLIHFPIALFFSAPLFILFARFTTTEKRQAFLISALVLMLLGTASMYATYETGEAAASTISKEEIRALVEQHKELASLARSSFTVATLLFGFVLLLCVWLRLRLNELTGVLPFASVAFYIAGLYWLVHAAYRGERLVHQFRTGAMMNP